jgi:hypothetical protein
MVAINLVIKASRVGINSPEMVGILTSNVEDDDMVHLIGMLPIRKTSPDTVKLTSYYGTVFVSRSEKRVNDSGTWLRNQIVAKGLDPTDDSVTSMHPGTVFDNLFDCPKLYSTLALGFRGFTLTAERPDVKRPTPSNIAFKEKEPEEDISKWAEIKHQSVMSQNNAVPKQKVAFDPQQIRVDEAYTYTFALQFDHTRREALYGRESIAIYEKDGSIIIGHAVNSDGVQRESDALLVLDKNDFIYITADGILQPFGTIEELLGLDIDKEPIDFAEAKVLGRTIPIGIILGYEIGLDRLIKLLKVNPRRVPAGTRVNLMPNEYPIVFSDETLVFQKDNKEASMILAGFNEYHKVIRQYSVHEFDKRGIYLNVLESNGASARYVREIDLLYQMYIDPITRDLLIEMKEPLNFRDLLIRSCQMLLNDKHPDELDSQYMRIKGYERMAGAVYGEIVRAIRGHNGRIGKSKVPIDLNPYAVWKNIMQDPSVALVSDINPVQNLKEMEAVTFAGTGGRNSRSMTKNARIYHANDMGTISEATSDSKDVAVNTYLSADPQFTSLRGMSRRYKIGETGATALISTTALLSPASDRDD